jgi:hypothetical protein
VASHVTIIDPAHPLFKLTLPVIHAPVSLHSKTSLIVQLPNGKHRRVPYCVTDLAKKAADDIPPATTLLPISVRTLLPLAHYIRRLLGTPEESADESATEPTDVPPIDATPEEDNRPTQPMARPGSDTTTTTGSMPGRAHSTDAPLGHDPTRGGR